MYKDLNEKELEILNFLKIQINKKGYPPSVREICQAVGFKSTSTTHGYLSKLEKKDYIRRDSSKPRAIEILNNNSFDDFSYNKKTVNVPILGKVTAGKPILAVENIEDTFPLPVELTYKGNTFMLTVQGESMIDAGILDNDHVIVNQQSVAENGDIVVALIEDEATIKRFFKESDHIRLQPENTLMDPIIVKEVIILGKVIGVFRQY